MLTSCNVDRSDDVLTIEWSLAPTPALIWEHLQNPETLNEWLGQPRGFNTRVGGEIIVDHDDGYLCRSEILSRSHNSTELSWEFPDEPPTRLALSTFVADGTDENSPATSLVLQHFGLGALIDSYANGWLTHLSYFEASLWKTPLPPGLFWSLCATFSRLRSQRQQDS